MVGIGRAVHPQVIAARQCRAAGQAGCWVSVPAPTAAREERRRSCRRRHTQRGGQRRSRVEAHAREAAGSVRRGARRMWRETAAALQSETRPGASPHPGPVAALRDANATRLFRDAASGRSYSAQRGERLPGSSRALRSASKAVAATGPGARAIASAAGARGLGEARVSAAWVAASARRCCQPWRPRHTSDSPAEQARNAPRAGAMTPLGGLGVARIQASRGSERGQSARISRAAGSRGAGTRRPRPRWRTAASPRPACVLAWMFGRLKLRAAGVGVGRLRGAAGMGDSAPMLRSFVSGGSSGALARRRSGTAQSACSVSPPDPMRRMPQFRRASGKSGSGRRRRVGPVTLDGAPALAASAIRTVPRLRVGVVTELRRDRERLLSQRARRLELAAGAGAG